MATSGKGIVRAIQPHYRHPSKTGATGEEGTGPRGVNGLVPTTGGYEGAVNSRQ